MKSQVISRGRALFYILVFMLSSVLIGCETVDERELCCEEVELLYRYVRKASTGDEYKTFVSSMRHFLYDSQGRFIREVPSNPRHPQRLKMRDLPVGRYTMLTISNATAEHTTLNNIGEGTTLGEALLEVTTNKGKEAPYYENGDELFYNTRSFECVSNEKHTYYCDLSNVHCHLHVKVRWKEGRPKYLDGAYQLRQSLVANRYRLSRTPLQINIKESPGAPHGVSTYQQVVHSFPEGYHYAPIHASSETLFNMELHFYFVTLRYTNAQYPQIQLFRGGQAVSSEVDLQRAFEAWGWVPDEDAEQIYRIEMVVGADGSVELYPWSDLDVLDWVDGGTFG